jgi:hypothetical protein
VRQKKTWRLITRNKALKYIDTSRPCTDPEKAARRLLEIANTVGAVEDGRIHIEEINAPFPVRQQPGGNPTHA